MGSQRAAIISVALFFTLNGFLFMTFASRIPTIRDLHGLSEQQLGLLLLCTAIGAVTAMGLSGRWCDHFGQYYVAKRAAWLMVATVPFLALAPSPVFLGLALFFYGAFGGTLDLSMNGFTTEIEAERGSSIMSRVHGMWSLGAGLGAATGSLASKFGAPISLHFLLAIGLGAAALYFLDRSDWTKPEQTAPPAKVFVIPTGRLALIGLVALVTFMSEGVVSDWGTLYIVDRFLQPEATGSVGLVFFSVTMVTMRMSGDMILNRIGPQRAIIFASCTAAFGGALAVLAGVYWLVWIGFGIMGIGYALLAPIAFIGAGNQRHVSRGHAMAVVTMMGYGGMLIGPPLIGFVAEHLSLRAGFTLIMVATGAVVLLSPLFRKPLKA